MVCLFALHQGWEVIPLRGSAIDNSENGRTESLRQCDAVEVQHNGLCANDRYDCGDEGEALRIHLFHSFIVESD